MSYSVCVSSSSSFTSSFSSVFECRNLRNMLQFCMFAYKINRNDFRLIFQQRNLFQQYLWSMSKLQERRKGKKYRTYIILVLIWRKKKQKKSQQSSSLCRNVKMGPTAFSCENNNKIETNTSHSVFYFVFLVKIHSRVFVGWQLETIWPFIRFSDQYSVSSIQAIYRWVLEFLAVLDLF